MLLLLSVALFIGISDSFFLNGITNSRSCPDGSRFFQDNCYYFSDDEFNFVDAEVECHQLGGHLAADSNPQLHEFIKNVAIDEGRKHYWLGATDFVREGHWRWLLTGNDVGMSGFTAWSPGQPDNTSDLTNCMAAYIHDGTMEWRDYHCDIQNYAFVCEKAKNNVVVPIQGIVSGGCSQGWAEFREDCLYVSDTAETFLESEVDCRQMGGYLASDDSAEKHHFLTQIVQVAHGTDPKSFWIGGTDFVLPGEWRWSETGHPLSGYSAWDQGQPITDLNTNCMAMHWSGENMVWFSSSCEDHDFYYICEKPNPSFVNVPTTTIGTIIG